jgi:hypothetical protein
MPAAGRSLPWTPEQVAYHAEVTVHRALARHRPHERCAECPTQPERISMSWTVPCPSQTADTIDAASRAAYADYRAKYQADPGELVAMDDQFEVARAAAHDILASGAVGHGACMVMLAGHANPGHEPRPGWAHDAITVAITQH